MTVKQVYDKLGTFNNDERQRYAGGICKLLCPVSIQTLMTFQDEWDGSKPASEFFKAQAEEIKKCIDLEISLFGAVVRKTAGLEPLEWETEIAA